MKMPSPSSLFLDYASDRGPVVTEFDQFSQVIALPALIAASGRLRSLDGHINGKGKLFQSGGCHYLESNLTDAEAAYSEDGFCFMVSDAIPCLLYTSPSPRDRG